MHLLQQPQRTLAHLIGGAVGALGFLLSFVLAAAMLVREGNPGFLLIWFVAAMATAACMRVQIRWRKSFERMYSPQSTRTFYPARRSWRQNVEDIAFRDITDASMSFSQ